MVISTGECNIFTYSPEKVNENEGTAIVGGAASDPVAPVAAGQRVRRDRPSDRGPRWDGVLHRHASGRHSPTRANAGARRVVSRGAGGDLAGDRGGRIDARHCARVASECGDHFARDPAEWRAAALSGGSRGGDGVASGKAAQGLSVGELAVAAPRGGDETPRGLVAPADRALAESHVSGGSADAGVA
jgi:hypothetical protein